MNENPLKLKESLTLIKGMSIETVLQKKLSKLRETNISNLNFKQSQRNRVDKSVFVTQNKNVVGGGTNSILNALAAYLRYLEGTARDDWQQYVIFLYSFTVRFLKIMLKYTVLFIHCFSGGLYASILSMNHKYLFSVR